MRPPAALGHPHDVDEEAQALLGLGRQELDMRQMRQVEGAERRLQRRTSR